jgi:hypothetical protein
MSATLGQRQGNSKDTSNRGDASNGGWNVKAPAIARQK